jgi:hypothetical protein
VMDVSVYWKGEASERVRNVSRLSESSGGMLSVQHRTATTRQAMLLA